MRSQLTAEVKEVREHLKKEKVVASNPFTAEEDNDDITRHEEPAQKSAGFGASEEEKEEVINVFEENDKPAVEETVFDLEEMKRIEKILQ